MRPRQQRAFLQGHRCIGCEGFAANLRAERAIMQEHGKRASIGLLCDAHKAATISTLSFSLLKPLDTRLIGLSLSASGPVMQSIRREARAIIREQLVVIQSGVCPAPADAYRAVVYDMFIPDSPYDKYRKQIVSKLWNGDIRARGRIEHYERGCCSSPSQTRALMRNEGLRCLMGCGIKTLQRSSWTGTTAALNSIGLPAHVHGLLAAAYLRAMPAPAKPKQDNA